MLVLILVPYIYFKSTFVTIGFWSLLNVPHLTQDSSKTIISIQRKYVDEMEAVLVSKC